MSPEEYWDGEGIRFLNEDGTLPTVEQRVKEGFKRGYEVGVFDSEVERLREEVKNWHQHYRDEACRAQKCKQAFIEQEKEVARLRAEVQRAIEDRNRIGIEIRGEYLPKLKDQDNEVARLREENECFKRGCQGSCYACEPVGEMNLKLEAEVARLRELLNRAIEIGKITTEYIEDPDRRKHYRSAIQEIATAPEEPVIQENRITEPEWREFGPDEVIKEGEWYRRHYGEWVKVWITEGDRVCMHKGLRFRTRRPLPNPSEPPKSSKQEEMPLEDELKDIDQYADKQNDFHTCRVFQSIEYSLHYLRDEIQKLKEAR